MATAAYPQSVKEILAKLIPPPDFGKSIDQLIEAADRHLIRADELVREVNKRCLIYVLRKHGWNQCHAAEDLQMHRNTLGRQIQELEIVIPPEAKVIYRNSRRKPVSHASTHSSNRPPTAS